MQHINASACALGQAPAHQEHVKVARQHMHYSIANRHEHSAAHIVHRTWESWGISEVLGGNAYLLGGKGDLQIHSQREITMQK